MQAGFRFVAGLTNCFYFNDMGTDTGDAVDYLIYAYSIDHLRGKQRIKKVINCITDDNGIYTPTESDTIVINDFDSFWAYFKDGVGEQNG